MIEPSTQPDRAGVGNRGTEENDADRAFRRYFEQLVAVMQAMTELRAALTGPSPAAVFYASSVLCAWGVLEAKRTILETVTGNGSWSSPGLTFLRDQLVEVLEDGWYRVGCQPEIDDAFILRLRSLEDLLLPT